MDQSTKTSVSHRPTKMSISQGPINHGVSHGPVYQAVNQPSTYNEHVNYWLINIQVTYILWPCPSLLEYFSEQRGIQTKRSPFPQTAILHAVCSWTPCTRPHSLLPLKLLPLSVASIREDGTGGLDQYLTFTDTDKARGFPIRPTRAPPLWDDITRQFIGHGGHPRGPIRAINSLSFAQLPPDALISRVLEVGEIWEQMARTSCTKPTTEA